MQWNTINSDRFILVAQAALTQAGKDTGKKQLNIAVEYLWSVHYRPHFLTHFNSNASDRSGKSVLIIVIAREDLFESVRSDSRSGANFFRSSMNRRVKMISSETMRWPIRLFDLGIIHALKILRQVIDIAAPNEQSKMMNGVAVAH